MGLPLASNLITAIFTLPCGCKLEHAYSLNHLIAPEHFEGTLENAASVLGYWAQHRARYHRCDLVSDDNPHGSDRERMRADREEAEAAHKAKYP